MMTPRASRYEATEALARAAERIDELARGGSAAAAVDAVFAEIGVDLTADSLLPLVRGKAMAAAVHMVEDQATETPKVLAAAIFASGLVEGIVVGLILAQELDQPWHRGRS